MSGGLHLIKLSVGTEDVAHLARVQVARLKGEGRLVHITRNTPKRADELLAGGSIYWVIRRFVRVRQRLIGIERGVGQGGGPSCALVLDPALVKTELKEFRAFQGWRYFRGDEAPADLGAARTSREDALPEELECELRKLGLL